MKDHETPLACFVSGQEKITPHHLERLVYIYVRQSSPSQVLHNTGSQENQYRLAERAAALGWSRTRVRIIDADQGITATESGPRSGFQELLAEVSLGHVGIIFGFEVSRLARNCADWYRLLDLAAVFNTLVADYDGIYDLRLINDRLLLGLKGTMSEAEMHLLRLRLQEGRMRKVERGEYRNPLPTGLVRLPDGKVIKDPDDQVRHTLELVFAKFEELGSARKVLRYLCNADILLPRRQRSGPQAGLVVWKHPSQTAVYAILTNPAYAGAFAFGRQQVDPTRQQPGRPRTGIVVKPIEEWKHLQLDAYPAYITWEQYLANQERMHQNATRFTEAHAPQGAARKGAALLQGLATCGECGHWMVVAYKSAHRYVCHELVRQFGEPSCASLHGPSIDAVVVQAFFEAIKPAQLDVLEAVLEDQKAEQSRLNRQWGEKLKRAQYEAHLAQRQYDAVDPDNRLVAAELERRWEEMLCQLHQTEEAFRRFQQAALPTTDLSPQLREQFCHLSDALPELWTELTNDERKELLRSLIDRVIVKRVKPDTIEVKIVWVSGHYSIDHASPPIFCNDDLTNYDELVERIHTLWKQGVSDKQIAARLTAEGFRSARSMQVSPNTVQNIRLRHIEFRQTIILIKINLT